MSQMPQGGFPFHLVQLPWQYPQQQPQRQAEEVPARVRTAMHFFDQISGKTASTVAVGSVGSPEQFDGQKLTCDEENALVAAVVLLEQYFRGQLRQTDQEKTSSGTWNGMAGLPIKCYFCFDPRDETNWPKAGCPCCKGCGQLMVFPLVNREVK